MLLSLGLRGPFMRFVILHYHIFKNAGSTIEDILDHSFGERFGQLETTVEGGLISNSQLLEFLDSRPELKAFSSHQIRYPMPVSPDYLFFDICLVRDPLDRLRSFYDYFRQRPNPADPMSDIANSNSLGDFAAIMIREHSLFVRNNQVNLLACGGDSDEPGEQDLDLAIRRMKASSFPGVVDRFAQSVAAGAARLRMAFPELDFARPAVNVSRGMRGTVAERIAELRAACHPDVYEQMVQMTELDRRLVDETRAEVDRRAASATVCEPSRSRSPKVEPKPERTTFFTKARQFVSLAPYWRELARYSSSSLPKRSTEGAPHGPRPRILFDPAFYVAKYPEVAASGMNPLIHYLKHGAKELRQPHPLFDPVFYLDQYPDVRRAGLNPLLHYLRNGAAEDRKPHPLFDPLYYRANCRPPIAADEYPLFHFLRADASAANPHPLFNCGAYLAAHPDVAEAGLNPLVHYLLPRPGMKPKPAAATGRLLELEIDDVRLEATCLDAAGGVDWIAEPQQLLFLQSLNADQVHSRLL